MKTPGNIILFGSGETTPQAIKLLWKYFGAKKVRQRLAILETPAGFQPNSSLVAQEIANTYQHSLGAMIEQIAVVPARSKADPQFSTNNTAILEPIKSATCIFMGPGSPTYTVSQLKDSLALKMIIDQWQAGATLIFSSAATLAVGTKTLPVYEIFKVGTDLHWVEGLDVLSSVFPNTTIVGHWNNTDGGNELDTSHCYMGQSRFLKLKNLLPVDTAVFGIDENTGVIINNQTRVFMPIGLGTACRSVMQRTQKFVAGQVYSIDSFEQINSVDEAAFFDSIKVEENEKSSQQVVTVPADIQALLEQRKEAKENKNYQLADAIRQQIYSLGFEIEDTNQGSKLIQKSSSRIL